MKISIVIPVYNEFVTLPARVTASSGTAVALGSPARGNCCRRRFYYGTTFLWKKDNANDVVIVHHSVVNFGKGAAVRVGIARKCRRYRAGTGRRSRIRSKRTIHAFFSPSSKGVQTSFTDSCFITGVHG